MLEMAITAFRGQYRWLSNFWLDDVIYQKKVYPSVEHAYQAAKASDPRIQEQIRRAPTPGDAKRLGRQIPLKPGWDEFRLGIMEMLLHRKFIAGSPLGNRLIETYPEELIEGNTWG